jgi:hypothetical protein
MQQITYRKYIFTSSFSAPQAFDSLSLHILWQGHNPQGEVQELKRILRECMLP